MSCGTANLTHLDWMIKDHFDEFMTLVYICTASVLKPCQFEAVPEKKKYKNVDSFIHLINISD